MCDTLVIRRSDGLWFAKNSDREPGEPQLVVRLPAVHGDDASQVKLTHITIPQVADRLAVILSKPHWIWGAEMGINEAGVAIGNEAIFSRLRSQQPALLGMDLVRLGLERGRTAEQALDVMTQLLEQHGQGGPAGHRDRGFHYDNSFIIADQNTAWVLETAGQHWVARQVRDSAAISNCLTIDRHYDRHSTSLDRLGKPDFAAHFDSRLMPWFASAHQRLHCNRDFLHTADDGLSLGMLAAQLRSHAHQHSDPLKGSNADVCMHAAGPIRRSQTCGSMIARLSPGRNQALFTGTSAPCLSIFRPASFATETSVLTADDAPIQESLWVRFESLHQAALFNPSLREELRRSRDLAEARLLASLEQEEADLLAADQQAQAWLDTALEILPDGGPRLPRNRHGLFWRRAAWQA